jgi:hypothetical protein
MEYGGKDEEAAETYLSRLDFELAYGYSWDEHEEAYRLGDISEEELVQGYMDVQGITRDEAEINVEYLDFTNDNPELRVLSVAQYRGYYSAPEGWNVSPADIGIDVRMYAQYRLAVAGMRGDDLDGDGETDRNSKKNKILAFIDSLPLTPEQKDLLYYQQGWASSQIKNAPWH